MGFTHNDMTSNTKINVNTAHLPLTALAWQSWKLLVVLVLGSFACVGVGGVALLVLVNSVQTPNDKLRESYYKQCYAQFALKDGGMRPDTGFQLCHAEARLRYPED
jgi:hypothetical protein